MKYPCSNQASAGKGSLNAINVDGPVKSGMCRLRKLWPKFGFFNDEGIGHMVRNHWQRTYTGEPLGNSLFVSIMRGNGCLGVERAHRTLSLGSV